MLNEPNYHLTDSDGNIIGTIGADSNGDVVVEHASSGTQVTIGDQGIQTPALSTEQATFTTGLGSTGVLTDAQNANSLQDIAKKSSVGTSATTILTVGSHGALVVVTGVDQNDPFDQFTDVVSYNRAVPPTVIAQNTRSNAASRTYTENDDELQLAMGSSTFNVIARGIRLQA